MREPHVVLGIPRSASPGDAKAAYRALARKHHPDAGGDPETFKEIAAAYKLISAGRVALPGGAWVEPARMPPAELGREIARLKRELVHVLSQQEVMEAKIKGWCLIPGDPAGEKRASDHRDPIILRRTTLEEAIKLLESLGHSPDV